MFTRYLKFLIGDNTADSKITAHPVFDKKVTENQNLTLVLSAEILTQCGSLKKVVMPQDKQTVVIW